MNLEKKNIISAPFLFAIIFLSLICISSVSALTININATKTTYVRQDTANADYGTSLNLELRNGDTNARRIYLYFPVGLALNNSITQASLCLYQITSGTTLNGFAYYLYSDWKNISNSNQILNETELTWNNQPCGVNFNNATNCNLTQIDGQAIDSTGAYECWNVTNIATKEYYNKNISFVIKSAENSPLTNDVFASRRNNSYIPYLLINFIDTTPPNINFTNPTTSGQIVDRHFILINVTANDDIGLANITIRLSNATGIVNTTSSTTSPYFVNISNLPYGTYYFNATARDTSNNRNVTETRNITLTCLPNWVQYNSTCNLQNTTYYLYNDTKSCNSTLNLPVNNGTSSYCLYLSVNIVSPPNNTITNVTGQNLTINVTGNASISNITWIISNGTAIINETTISGQKGVIGEMFSFLYDGIFNWFVRVTDIAGNIFTSAINYIFVDTTQPFLNIISPLNNGYYNISALNFEYTISDNLAGLDKCWFVNSTTTSFVTCGNNLSLIALEGTNTWYIYANDTAGNINTKNVTFFVDTIMPLINFENPTLPDNSYVSQNYILINVSAGDTNFQNITYSLRNSSGTLTIVGFGSLTTSYTWTNLADDTYNYSVFIRDIANNRNSTGMRTIKLDATAPNMILLEPLNETENIGETISFGLNVTDNNNVSSVQAIVTKPDNTTELVEMTKTPNYYSMFSENISIGQNQTCITQISNNSLNTSIAGDGNPNSDTLCSLIGSYPLFSDFEAVVNYNLINLSLDSAINFQIMSEAPSSANSYIDAFIGRTNFAGQVNQYQVYGEDNYVSGYINQISTSDTSGSMKIKRIGNDFSFYVLNNTDSSWIFLGNETLDMHTGIFYALESESISNNYGTANVEWTNFTITNLDSNTYIGIFSNTSLLGNYIVNFSSNDSLNNVRNNVTSSFNIQLTNYAPSTPFIINPVVMNVYNNTIDIIWTKVIDVNNDDVFFNISLLNPDYSFNQTIIDNYGNLSFDNYIWDTISPNIKNGNYSIRVSVKEKNTYERYEKTDKLLGYFILNNPFYSPQNMLYINFTEINGSIIGRDYIQVNVSSIDTFLKNITINFFNSSGFIGSSTGNYTPFSSQLINLSDGRYFFNAISCNQFNLCNSLPMREVYVNKSLNTALQITLGVPSYPYVAVNVTYPLQVRVFLGNSNVLDATTSIIIHSPDGTNSTFYMVLNPINSLYETSLIFSNLGDYPFTINANSFAYGHKDISGTFLVRQSYNVTFCAFNQDDNYASYVNNYAYLIAEPTTSKAHYDNTLEQFLTPLLFAGTYKTPVFYTLYRNGCGTLILFDKEEYALRLFDGQATFTETLSAPNISKTYGTNMYLGKFDLNGTNANYSVLITDKDIHPYRWLANWIFIIVIVFALLLSLALIFFIPQYPIIPFYVGIGFISMACLIRIVIWLVWGI